ncbi:MAG: DUF1592 domain-containing protein, partial [Phycisphaerae bacterium]|nr:DUF1592 domain-containing protein [Phycisphaerae bacterium]
MSKSRGFISSNWVWGVGCAALVILCSVAGAEEVTGIGGHIYQRRCANCHGNLGEGVKEEHDKPLVGDKSALQLARYVDKWMPEDEPKLVAGDDARQVARYIHDAFYSPIAQARHRPARIALSRLTVRQYRHSVADLVGSFGTPVRLGDRRGLSGKYFNAQLPKGKVVLERLDPAIDFAFGQDSPAPDKLGDQGFSARWEGSLIAPETGMYQLTVRSGYAIKLWVNDPDSPLIDAWVKSSEDRDHRRSIFLIGGRAYPLTLEFSSRRQGVNDKKKKWNPKGASVQLRWKLPKRAAEVIPARYLVPEVVEPLFVVGTPFPPDDRSIGYELGTSVSRAWDEATTRAAIESAGYVLDHFTKLAGTRAGGSDARRHATKFCQQLVERAFRRPLTEAERRLYVERQFSRAPDVPTAVKRVVILSLKSPRFLYPYLGDARSDDYGAAAKLALTLWDSLPDADLLEAAEAGRLQTRGELLAQAKRMLKDPRARSKLRQFFHRWLQIEGVSELVKDAKKLPGFGPEVASDLRSSLDLFLEQIVWQGDSDFRELMLSREWYVNGRLAKLYGVDLPPDAPFQKVAVDGGGRMGILAHPYLLARFAYADTTSPIHRGVFLARSVFGRSLRPPPEAVAPEPVELHPDLTTRERVTRQTGSKACQACHRLINELGFTLEHFDAVGRFREKDQGKPIDASGAYRLPSGEDRALHGAAELATFASKSEQVHRAFVVQLFHHLVKQSIAAYGPETAQSLHRSFAV